MCLLSLDNELTEKYKNKTKDITAYKVVFHEDEKFFPVFNRTDFFSIGNNVSKMNHRIHTFSKWSDSYDSGFHSFLNKKDAKLYLKSLGRYDPLFIIKVKIKPKNITAIGLQDFTIVGKYYQEKFYKKCIVGKEIYIESFFSIPFFLCKMKYNLIKKPLKNIIDKFKKYCRILKNKTIKGKSK